MSILCAANGAVYIIEHEWTCRLYNDSCYRSSFQEARWRLCAQYYCHVRYYVEVDLLGWMLLLIITIKLLLAGYLRKNCRRRFELV